MADNTRIEWADATLNYINGCTRVSPGCGGPGPHGGCYAERLAGTRLRNHPSREGLTRQTAAGPRWTGEVRAHEPALLQALAWKRGRRIFWNAHGDLFHDSVPDGWIDRLFAVCALTPQHTHMILTKRSARMREYVSRVGVLGNDRSYPGHAILTAMDGLSRAKWPDLCWPLPNVWLGVSVEDQQRADERIPDLLATPAAVRFISAEPLLGPVDLTDITIRVRQGEEPSGLAGLDALTGVHWDAEDTIVGIYGNPDPRIDWVIAGGESGPNARPMHPDWARSQRDQCAGAGIPFHFKQWGEWAEVDQFDPTGDSLYHWLGDRYGKPRYSSTAISIDGATGPRADDLKSPTTCVYRVGKKRAGRLLDGRTHDDFPGVRP